MGIFVDTRALIALLLTILVYFSHANGELPTSGVAEAQDPVTEPV